jgi:hypothetical protein
MQVVGTGRQRSDVVVLRELTLAVAKLTKTPMAGFEKHSSLVMTGWYEPRGAVFQKNES